MNTSYVARATLLSAALAAAFAISAGTPAFAAPADYATDLLADNPYVYFRFQETGTLTDANALDLGTRPIVSPGVYRGTPTSEIPGAGASSDTAVSFPGATVPGNDYLRTTDALGFGSNVATSSYEFLFKVNPGFSPTALQSLFGTFNTGNTLGVDVTLNSRGNDALDSDPNTAGTQGFANTTRLYIRGDDGDGVGVSFVNPRLYDGNYHHLVFTFDRASLSIADTPLGIQSFTGGFAAYVDGIPQQLTLWNVNASVNDPNAEPDGFSDFGFPATFAARNVRGTPGRDAAVTLDEAAIFTTVLSEQTIADRGTWLLTPGDANGDGVIGADDIALLDHGFALYQAGSIPAGQALFRQGDFNRDGAVDSQDYSILYAALSPPAAGPLGAMPEPASLAACGFVLLPLARRRPRSVA